MTSVDPKEARRDDEIRADAHAWRSGDYVDRLRIERLADDVPSLLDRATTAEAERDDAYARGFEQVRRRCEAAEAEVETWKETAKSLQKSLTAAIEGQRQASAERDAALLVADQIENGCGPGVVDIIGRISGECIANRNEAERLRDALASADARLAAVAKVIEEWYGPPADFDPESIDGPEPDLRAALSAVSR